MVAALWQIYGKPWPSIKKLCPTILPITLRRPDDKFDTRNTGRRPVGGPSKILDLSDAPIFSNTTEKNCRRIPPIRVTECAMYNDSAISRINHYYCALHVNYVNYNWLSTVYCLLSTVYCLTESVHAVKSEIWKPSFCFFFFGFSFSFCGQSSSTRSVHWVPVLIFIFLFYFFTLSLILIFYFILFL